MCEENNDKKRKRLFIQFFFRMENFVPREHNEIQKLRGKKHTHNDTKNKCKANKLPSRLI